jgi:DNA-directed RNA polymerase subunit beta'
MRKVKRKEIINLNLYKFMANQLRNIKDIDYISISLASPEDILSWSYGEVIKPETLNYRTQRPEKEGLFSEKIFGPTRDYECYCGKYKKIRYKGVVCERCGVEVTRSSVRRERMGHISLAVPVVNIWFLRTIPSKLGTFLGIPISKLERVVYYADYIVTEVNDKNRKQALDLVNEEYKSLKSEEGEVNKNLEDSRKRSEEILKNLKKGMILSEDEYFLFAKRFGDVFNAGRGAEAILEILKSFNLHELARELEEKSKEIRDSGRKKEIMKRLKLVKSFIESGSRPEWMIMTVVPVLPPDLRPMVALDGGRFATADLNDLYRRVINRNNRLKKLIELKSPDVILTNEKRMLQEAVDALIDNTKRAGSQVMSSRRRPLKSLAGMLKGKQGRFRQNLLGKRVDYSGRSVIAVGPGLDFDQCGLPKNLAMELFRPFVINKIISRGLAYNIKQANRLIEQSLPEVWAILEEVIEDKMVLLNRAPTLHRLGIQAFYPVLIEDLAIRLHPLVCSAFNADFDGDQMAVHLPLTEEAQYECRELMNVKKNILKPASGDPIVSPTQDMVLGCYYLTQAEEGGPGEGKVFSSFSEVEYAYEKKVIDIPTKIKVPVKGKLIETTYGRIIFNSLLPDDFRFVNQKLNKKGLGKVIAELVDEYGIGQAYIYLDRIKNTGFKYSTLSAISFGMTDIKVPEGKKKILDETENLVSEIESQYEEGLLTDNERKERVIELWTEAKDKIGDLVPETLGEESSVNVIISSGARGNWTQSNQIMGMRGLVANPRGETIELPVRASYKEGLSILEFFISTHGARKGTTDTALKTASAGYLTRRLVDVAQDVIVREHDCGTTTGIDIIRSEGEEYGHKFGDRLYSRVAAEDVKEGNKVLVKGGEVIDRRIAQTIEDSKIASVKVRSPITCNSKWGVCAKCYGWDLTKEELVTEGEAVGIVAAQSIGEPGTQLTMRTFHIGGIAGVDITHGLPRAEEIFESRNPKGKAVMTKVDGTVASIEEKGTIRTIKINEKGKKKSNVEYSVPPGVKLYVKKGDVVDKGDLLCEGPLDLREMLKYRKVEDLERYIVNEVQKIYVPEGASINDKHVEIIVRQMLSKVAIKDSGDTDFVVDELVDKSKLKEVNRKIKEAGGEPAKADQRVLGITKIALNTESFLSSASFQETSRVLVNAAIEGRVDELRGLKENVIIGKVIPAGTGWRGIPDEVIEEAIEKERASSLLEESANEEKLEKEEKQEKKENKS